MSDLIRLAIQRAHAAKRGLRDHFTPEEYNDTWRALVSQQERIAELRAGFESEEEQSYVHNEVTGLHNEADLREIERLEAVVAIYVEACQRTIAENKDRTLAVLVDTLSLLGVEKDE